MHFIIRLQHVITETFFLAMTNTVIYQSIDLSSRDASAFFTLWKTRRLDPSSFSPLSFMTRTRIVLLCLPAVSLHALTRFLVPLAYTPSRSISLFNFYDEELEQRIVWRSQVFSQRPYSTLGKIARFAPWHLTIPYDVYVIIKWKHLDTPLEENSSIGNMTFHFDNVSQVFSISSNKIAYFFIS